VRAQRHDGVVDLAIARIEDIAILVLQAVAPHAAYKRKPEQRRIGPIARTLVASRIGLIARSGEQLGDRTLKNPPEPDDKEPDNWSIRLMELLPYAGDRGLLPRGNGRGRAGQPRKPRYAQQCQWFVQVRDPSAMPVDTNAIAPKYGLFTEAWNTAN